MARQALSKKTRFEVFKRDGFSCQYCGATPPQVVLHVDHVHPVAEGGANDQDNLVTACEACNQGKAANLLSSVPISLKDKAALIAEKEAQLRGYHEVMEAKRARLEDESWRVADVFMKQFHRDWMSKSDLQSIRQFIEKIGVHEVLDAAELAVARKPYGGSACWKYFCGICWNKVRRGEK